MSKKDLMREIIRNLLNNRDYLGYQLDNALGNLSDEYLSKMEKKHLNPPKKYKKKKLIKMIRLLGEMTGGLYDSDEISAMFNSDHTETDKVITDIYFSEEKK